MLNSENIPDFNDFITKINGSYSYTSLLHVKMVECRMQLDWVSFTFDIVISAIELFFVMIIAIDLYVNHKHRNGLIFTWVSFVWGISLVVMGIGYLLTSTLFLVLAQFLQFGYMFALVYLIDVMTRESMDPFKLSIVLILATASSILLVVGNFGLELNLIPPGSSELILFISSVFDSILTLMIGILWIVYNGRIYLNAPKNLKIHAGVVLFIATVTGLGSISISLVYSIIKGISTGNPLSEFALMYEPMFIIVTGAVLIGLVWKFETRLWYVLPFRAYQLTILETKGGIPLYTHVWNKRKGIAEDALFSGMLQGIGMILKEAVDKGNVREIILDEATLLLHHNNQYSVACVLVTTRSSQSLRQAMSFFDDRFITEYAQYLSSPSEIQKFAGVSEIVTECFPFVVEYE